jgi:hypothetical protein
MASSDSEFNFSEFINLFTFGRTTCTGISPTQGLYLHWTTQHRKTGHTSVHRAGFEIAIPVSERSKIVRALERAATGTG